MTLLKSLGAGVRLLESFASGTTDGLELGRVSFSSHERYRVWLEAGEVEAAVSGKLRYEAELPVVGDWVRVRPVDATMAWIEGVLPRQGVLARRAAGSEGEAQILASNVDLALVVCGLDGDWNPRRIERYLVLVQASGVAALVVLNKRDQCEDLEARVEEVQSLAADVPVVTLEARRSVEELRKWVGNKSVVLLGSSGAGKSTIANGLLGSASLRTGPVRAEDSRGRHTTTFRMLVPLPRGGALIDTPGLRELGLSAREEDVEEAFAWVKELAARCRFGDCRHEGEPGCAVARALETGEIEPERWESFLKLRREARHFEVASNLDAQRAQKQKWKAIHKAMRHHPKYKDR